MECLIDPFSCLKFKELNENIIKNVKLTSCIFKVKNESYLSCKNYDNYSIFYLNNNDILIYDKSKIITLPTPYFFTHYSFIFSIALSLYTTSIIFTPPFPIYAVMSCATNL
jgi:hypothetical protein